MIENLTLQMYICKLLIGLAGVTVTIIASGRYTSSIHQTRHNLKYNDLSAQYFHNIFI
jgi:hypothetical protein